MENFNQRDLSSHKQLLSSELVTFWNQLSRALKTMRQKHIVHRDLKPENIFMHDGQIKIGGFGLAIDLSKGDAVLESTGTPSYLAPEILRGRNLDYGVDLWASGVILYQLLVGSHPYLPPSEEQSQNIRSINRYIYQFDRTVNRMALIQPKYFVPVVDGLLQTRIDQRRIIVPIAFHSRHSFCGVDFELTQRLGSGSFGKVYQDENVATKEVVAIKCRYNQSPCCISTHSFLVVEISTARQVATFQNEVNIMKQFIGDQRFVQMHCASTDGSYSVIVMEYCNQGDLSTAGKLPAQALNTVWHQLSRGLAAMRAKRIIHRDLKPANIFLHDGSAKIGDFGLAMYLKEGQMATQIAGTVLFLAQEVLWYQPYDFQVDLWSTGVVLYVALHGINPFTRQGNPPSVQELLDSMDAFLADNHRYDPLLQDIFDGLLQRDPKDRRIHRI